MRNLLKKYFRDVVISIMFVLGMSLTFFLVLNVMGIYNDIKKADNHPIDDNYSFDYYIRVYPFESANDKYEFTYKMINTVSEFDGNVIMSIGMVSSGRTNDTSGGDAVVSMKEDMYFRGVDEKIHTIRHEDADMQGVYISEGLQKLAEDIDNSNKIIVNNEYYRVLNIVKDYSVDKSENSIIMFWNNLTDEAKQSLIYGNRFMMEEGVYFEFVSNKGNVKSSFDNITEKIKKNVREIKIGEVKKENINIDSSDNTYVKSELFLSRILIAFSLVNCIYISNLWINRKKKELVIRKTFGYSVWNIVTSLLGQLIKIGIMSMIISIILQLSYSKIMNTQFNSITSAINIVQILGGMIGVVIVSMIIPMISVILVKPAKGVR